MSRALERSELVVRFQPQVDLRTGAPHAVESLVRWRHPRLGLLWPHQFIADVERSPLIEAMTLQVLDLTAQQAALWQRELPSVRAAVNVSASTLLAPDFPARALEVARRRSMEPSAFELEVTERDLPPDEGAFDEVVGRLVEMGFSVSLDDYGTGYSALARLARLPVTKVKLDRSFVSEVGTSTRSSAIIQSTVALANALQIEVLAEGIETTEVRDRLVELGCHFGQGYAIARPMHGTRLAAWLTRRAELTRLHVDDIVPAWPTRNPTSRPPVRRVRVVLTAASVGLASSVGTIAVAAAFPKAAEIVLSSVRSTIKLDPVVRPAPSGVDPPAAPARTHAIPTREHERGSADQSPPGQPSDRTLQTPAEEAPPETQDEAVPEMVEIPSLPAAPAPIPPLPAAPSPIPPTPPAAQVPVSIPPTPPAAQVPVSIPPPTPSTVPPTVDTVPVPVRIPTDSTRSVHPGSPAPGVTPPPAQPPAEPAAQGSPVQQEHAQERSPELPVAAERRSDVSEPSDRSPAPRR